MKREELIKILGEDVPSDTIDAILNSNGADIEAAKNSQSSKVSALTEQNASLAEQVKELTEKQNSNMSEQEKAAKALEDALNASKEANARIAQLAAEKEFADAGIKESEYKDFIGSLTGLDEEKAKAAAKAIASVVTKHAETAAAAAKKEALEGFEPPAGGSDGQITTQKEFNALPYEKQLELVQADPTFISKLSKE